MVISCIDELYNKHIINTLRWLVMCWPHQFIKQFLKTHSRTLYNISRIGKTEVVPFQSRLVLLSTCKDLLFLIQNILKLFPYIVCVINCPRPITSNKSQLDNRLNILLYRYDSIFYFYYQFLDGKITLYEYIFD